MPGNTSTECVVAQVRGNAYRALMEWRDEADLEVLRAQIAHRGRARVVRLRKEHVFTEITELPGPGEAEPFYGTFGGGYESRRLDAPSRELRPSVEPLRAQCAHPADPHRRQ
jgi:hypothetical protein